MSDRFREWSEEFRVRGDRAVQRIRELINEGKARKIIVKRPNGEIIREIPLNQGVAVGGVATLIAPALVMIGAAVALLSEVRIEVIRSGDPDETTSPGSSEQDNF